MKKAIFYSLLFMSCLHGKNDFLWTKVSREYIAGYVGFVATLGSLNMNLLVHELGHATIGAASGLTCKKITIGPKYQKPFMSWGRFEYNPGNVLRATYYHNPVPNSPRLVPMIAAGPIAAMLYGYGMLRITGESSFLRYAPYALILEKLRFSSSPRIFLAATVLKKCDDFLVHYNHSRDMEKTLSKIYTEPVFNRTDNGIFSLLATYVLFSEAKQLTPVHNDGLDILESFNASEYTTKKIKVSSKVFALVCCGLGIKKILEEKI